MKLLLLLQHERDDPGKKLGEGCNGAVQELCSVNLPRFIMKCGSQKRLRLEAELLSVCRHPTVMQASALLLDRDSPGPDPNERGFLVVEQLGPILDTLLYPVNRSAPFLTDSLY